jgi:hypothetical protein
MNQRASSVCYKAKPKETDVAVVILIDYSEANRSEVISFVPPDVNSAGTATASLIICVDSSLCGKHRT